MATKFWKNVSIDVQSALATAKTITAISKSNVGQVTHDGAIQTEGDYVLLSVAGMTQLNNRVVRVTNPSASPTDFDIDEVDTSNFGTFTSGSFQLITFGTSLTTITGITTSGGEPEFDDTSVIHSDERTQAPTVTTPFTVTLESTWDPADTGLVALKSASDVQASRAVRVTFGDGSRFAFYAYVNATLIPQGAFPNKVTTTITFTAIGRNTPLSD